MLNYTKHNHPKSTRICLDEHSLLNGFVLYRKKLLLFFFLHSITSNAQFFVAKDASVYIDAKETVYVGHNTAYLLSEIENKGVLILDHTHTLYLENDSHKKGITFTNTANLEIKKIENSKYDTRIVKNKIPKQKNQSIAQKSSEILPSSNNPYNKGAMYNTNQPAIASPSTSYRLKKNTVLVYLDSCHFESVYRYNSTIPAKQNHTRLPFKENKISLKNNSRPPPFFCS